MMDWQGWRLVTACHAIGESAARFEKDGDVRIIRMDTHPTDRIAWGWSETKNNRTPFFARAY